MNAVVTLKAEHSLTDLLAAAGLARSTFFYHQARLDAPDPRAELKAAITDVFLVDKARYGYRRVHSVLVRAGWRVNRKTVLKGNCFDNAVIENFFDHLKEECFHHVRYLNIDALEAALHEYIRWYNNDRITERLKGLSPAQHRTQTLAA